MRKTVEKRNRLGFNHLSFLWSSFLLRFQICSQLSTRLEKQQAATKEELDAVRVRGDLSLFRQQRDFQLFSLRQKSSFSPPQTADVGVAAEPDKHQEILPDNIKSLPAREAGGLFQYKRDMRLKKMCFRGLGKRSVIGATAKRRLVHRAQLRGSLQGGAAYFTMIQDTNCEILTCATSAWESEFLKKKMGLSCDMRGPAPPQDALATALATC